MKRAVDIMISLLGLIFLSPVLAIVALAVRATTPGGALFVQPRVGRHESEFCCYKFRTMTLGAPIAGTHEVAGSWQTPFGGWLRRTRIDELPQLWNVLRGDMSLVGPRPCLHSQITLIAARRRAGVFEVRPGITGLAQVQGIDMSTPHDLAKIDRRYIENWSMAGDFCLLVRTVLPRAGSRVGL